MDNTQNAPAGASADCLPPNPVEEAEEKLLPYSIGLLTGAVLVALIKVAVSRL